MGADESRQSGPQLITGAAAIERYAKNKWEVSENVFTKAALEAASLLTYEIGAVVARLTVTIRADPESKYVVGVLSPKLSTDAEKHRLIFTRGKGGAGWDLGPRGRSVMQNLKVTHKGTACKAGVEGQRVVIEADGREGKRTLKLSQDGETQPVYFTNIPVPFRLGVCICWEDHDAVEIESLEIVEEPQMDGGTIPVEMDE
ncbi:hypothetical protein BLNAU_22591 [Blattamonas nauphoetae]|uniref:Uncharacterized protein n=1 Tax=Blattamonas nauphoetae TaxID=2049346 RepID=A0ABQ9WSL3_9EUKA|nr:hypothetical protein BLNAU_22591 [Blattamonas nauphoetae]